LSDGFASYWPAGAARPALDAEKLKIFSPPPLDATRREKGAAKQGAASKVIASSETAANALD
jgi:hypothetical protein